VVPRRSKEGNGIPAYQSCRLDEKGDTPEEDVGLGRKLQKGEGGWRGWRLWRGKGCRGEAGG